MKQYHDLLARAMFQGTTKADRTGTGTLSLFGERMIFDLAEGFPLVTTKAVHLKSVIHELLWFLSGATNVAELQANGVSIWSEWADENGELGPVYGKQWRSWQCRDGSSVDQIQTAINLLRKNPDSRRIIVSAWNVDDLPLMALQPCHVLFQFYSREMSPSERIGCTTDAQCNAIDVIDPKRSELARVLDDLGVPRRSLSCQVYQRSADLFLGAPFNVASYALLTMMMAQCTGHAPGELVWVGGDCHLYSNHVDQAKLQLEREHRPAPRMVIDPSVTEIDDFRFDHFELVGYDPHPAIKAEVAV